MEAILKEAGEGDVPDHITGIPVSSTKNVLLFQGVSTHPNAFRFNIGYNKEYWYVYSFNTIEEVAKRYEYAKELLGVGLIGDGWDCILSNLRDDIYRQDVECKRGNANMSLRVLKELVIEAGFTCSFIREKMSKNPGPFKISINRIDNSKPHTKDNCRVVQRRFQGHNAWNEAVFNNIFKHHDEFNKTLATKKYTYWHFEEQLHEKLRKLAVDANTRNKKIHKHFKYGKLPRITTEYMEELYKKQNGRCQYSRLLLVVLKADSHYAISIERINTRLPYIHGNICLVINCLNIIDKSGGRDWMKKHSNKLGRLLSFDEDEIVKHSPQGWYYDMVNGVREQVSLWV